MKERLLKEIGSLFRVLQFYRFPKAFLAKDNVRVTVTHSVFAEDLDNFDMLIRYAIAKRKAITPKDFFDSYKKSSFRGESLLFTFDDGLLSSYRAAKEILSRYGIKAIFFIPTAILDLKTKSQMKDFAASKLYFNLRRKDSFREEEYLTMGEKHLIDLYKEGHLVFPHTHNHCRLKDIKGESGIYEEIIKPKMILAKMLGHPMDAFAFPVGTERVISHYAYSAVKKVYGFCFTGMGGINTCTTDSYFIRRDCLHAHYDLIHARNVLEGSYDLFYACKMKILRNVVKYRELQ